MTVEANTNTTQGVTQEAPAIPYRIVRTPAAPAPALTVLEGALHQPRHIPEAATRQAVPEAVRAAPVRRRTAPAAGVRARLQAAARRVPVQFQPALAVLTTR